MNMISIILPKESLPVQQRNRVFLRWYKVLRRYQKRVFG